MEFIKGYNEAVIRKKSTLMCSLSSHRFEYLQCFQTLEIKRILKSTYIVQNVMLLLSFSFLFLSFVDLINVFASFLHIPRIKIYICIYYTYIHIYVLYSIKVQHWLNECAFLVVKKTLLIALIVYVLGCKIATIFR